MVPIKSKFDENRITSFQKDFLEALDTQMELSEKGIGQPGITLLGPSGSGKSHIIGLAERKINLMSGSSTDKTFLNITVPRKSTVDALVTSILEKTGMPSSVIAGFKKADIDNILYSQLYEEGVKVLCIQEAHNLVLASGKSLAAQSKNFLKNLWTQACDDTDRLGFFKDRPLTLVISGTNEFEKILTADDELRSRYAFFNYTKTYSVFPKSELTSFKELTHWMLHSEDLDDFIEKFDRNVCFILNVITNGHLREVSSIIKNMNHSISDFEVKFSGDLYSFLNYTCKKSLGARYDKNPYFTYSIEEINKLMFNEISRVERMLK